jgi:hypothetical protein
MKNTLIFSFLLITPFQYSFSQTPCCNPYIRDGEELERRGDYCKALSEFKRGINSCCGSNDGKINEVCCNTLKAKIREIQSRCRVREDDPLPSPIQANKHDDLWNSAKASKDYDSIKVHIICNDLTHRNEAKHLVQELEKKDTDRWNAVKTSMNIRKIKSEYLDKQIKPFNFVNEATDRVRKLNEEEELWGKIANSEDPETIQHVYRDSCELCAFDSLAIIRINWLIRAMKPELVFIKGGIFNMGNTFNKTKDLDISEKPHQVTVNNFYICKYEVSFKEFDVFCREQKRDKPDDNNWGRGKYPVMNITWYDAIEFCNWRSLKDTLTAVYKKSNEVDDSGRPIYIYSKSANGYRLPTEAEWEYAARGGENVPFGDGNENPDTKNFNFDGSMLKQSFLLKIPHFSRIKPFY